MIKYFFHFNALPVSYSMPIAKTH